jgi:aryl-alcohol dehydrogenase-like predicted oxidoreductase
MQIKPLPRTNIQVSVIGLGTDYFGSTIDRKLSMQILDRYVESGGNFIDTAEVYAGWISGGEHQSEKLIGDWLACIAHKSLEIFERCRLWQQNSPATPDNSAAFLERTISNSLF